MKITDEERGLLERILDRIKAADDAGEWVEGE